MSILLDIRSPNWMTEEGLRDFLSPLLPGVAIHCDVESAPLAEIRMLTVSRLRPGIVGRLPNVELVQKLGAGVDTIVTSPELRAGIRVTRLAPDAPAREIAEYCLAYVLRDQRHLREYESDTASRAWSPREPRQSVRTRVAVLGLGHIGARTARLFAALGFQVTGWSRSAKSIEGVACRAGADALPALLGEADYVVSILPSTPETRDLFDAAMLGRMKPGAVLVNAGRGDLIVEAELLDALDAGRPGGAVLDVFRQEPLPPDHPFWSHERVTVTPHVSGWHLDDGLKDVAENYRRLMEGEPLLHEIDRTLGY